MATERRNTRRYRTYGNVAYQPEIEREELRRSARQESAQREAERRRRPRIQPREQVAVRPSIQVRPQQAVAPFAVVGFAAVLVCAFLLVLTSAQLAVVNNDIVNLRSTLSDLQDEERLLQTQYEMTFDLEAIEAQFLADGTMVRAGSSQTVYLNLVEDDSVVYYEAAQGLSALLQRAEGFLAGMLP